MLVVRKEGKAHEQYNSFRSAFELLEAVGREPHDGFEDLQEGIPTVQKLQQQMISMQQQMQEQIDELKADNEILRSWSNQNRLTSLKVRRPNFIESA